MLAQSPCRRVPLPKVEREEMRFLTPAQVAALSEAIRPRYRALVLVAGYGGLRIGELAGLRRRRVDLLRGTSRWPRSWSRSGACCTWGRPRPAPVPHGRAAPIRGRGAGRPPGRPGRP
jgi:integrase